MATELDAERARDVSSVAKARLDHLSDKRLIASFQVSKTAVPYGGREMKRRAFTCGRRSDVLVFVLAPRATRSGLLFGQQQPQLSPDALEQRVAAVIQAYDAQGNHRTGTEVDYASAEWLAEQVRQLGAEPSSLKALHP